MKFFSNFEKKNNFFTLSSLNSYIQSLEEFPKPDNDDLLNPDFSSYYKKEKDTFFKLVFNKIKQFLGIQTESPWLIKLWVTIIEKLTEDREKNNYQGDFVLKFKPPVGSHFVIWGDLYGSIHSLMRDFEELNKQKILSEDLIISDGNFFVFNGNLIDLSPYSIEILIVVMQLMVKNPDKVVYIRGRHENKGEWHNYSLKRELKERAGGLSNERIPFDSLVKRFFNTLPLAIYLQSNNEFVRISSIDEQEIKLDEIEFIDNFQTQIIYLNKKQHEENLKKEVLVQVIIKSSERDFNYKPTKGLELLFPIKGITTWSILSSPGITYQKLFSFYNDAFVFLNIAEKLDLWSIVLNYQDIREKKGFKSKQYNFLTGLKLGNPVVKKLKELSPIILGCTLDLSEASRALGLRLREGIMLGINRENLNGGINEHLIKIIFLNDRYSPYLAYRNVSAFIEDYKTDIVISPLGTPTLEAYLSLVKSKKILVLFPYTGANLYRDPKIDYIINLRTSYSSETKALIDYAVNDLEMKRFVIFYQEDSYGRSGREGAINALERYSDVQFVEASHTRNNPNIGLASQKIINFNPEVLLLVSTYANSISLVHNLGFSFLANKFIMGVSFLTDTLKDYLQDRGLNLIISRLVPSLNSNIPIVNEYIEDMKKEYGDWHSLSADSLEAYINVRLFCHIARQINGPLTKEKIIDYVLSIKNYDFKGLLLNFDPNTRELYKKVWIDPGDGRYILAQDD